jgi:hypothetical protein
VEVEAEVEAWDNIKLQSNVHANKYAIYPNLLIANMAKSLFSP